MGEVELLGAEAVLLGPEEQPDALAAGRGLADTLSKNGGVVTATIASVAARKN